MSDESSDKKRRSARIHLILIGVIAVFPIVGSYVLYLFWKPSSFVNHGELVAGKHGVPASGDPMAEALKAVSGKWVLLMVDGGACDDACRKKLYYLRQLRLTQGKEMERIERMWVVTDLQPATDTLIKEFDGTRVIVAQDSAWVGSLASTGSARDYVFIVDPLGNLVLRYPQGFDPSGMKKDLMRLLRASRIG